jgi:alkylation response protein AidB-like acyl-CoA dehydrogenase
MTELFERVRRSNPLPRDEQEVFDLVRVVAREKVAPAADRFDETETFPRESIEHLTRLELNRVFLPEEHGGAALSFLCFLMLVEEISRACPSTAIIWSTTYHAMAPIIEYGSREQRNRFLPTVASGGLAAIAITEATGGSDATTMRTRFADEGAEVVIDGEKVFITNGDVADLCIVFGKWRELGEGKDAITALVVQRGTPGFLVGAKERKMGHRASSTVSLRFEDCRVPRENVIGAPGEGLKVLVAALNRSRPSISAQALGIAEAAFDDAVRYGNTRMSKGQPILKFQANAFALADLATRMALTQQWLYYVGRLVDQGISDVGVEASILKVAASDLAMAAADFDVQIHGGYGYMRGSRVERLFRDAKLTQIWEGTNEIQRGRIGKAFAGRQVATGVLW